MEDGPGTIYADLFSSLGFGIGGQSYSNFLGSILSFVLLVAQLSKSDPGDPVGRSFPGETASCITKGPDISALWNYGFQNQRWIWNLRLNLNRLDKAASRHNGSTWTLINLDP